MWTVLKKELNLFEKTNRETDEIYTTLKVLVISSYYCNQVPHKTNK